MMFERAVSAERKIINVLGKIVGTGEVLVTMWAEVGFLLCMCTEVSAADCISG